MVFYVSPPGYVLWVLMDCLAEVILITHSMCFGWAVGENCLLKALLS